MDEAEITKALQSDLNFHKVKAQVKQREDLLHILITRNDTNDLDYSVLFEVIQRSIDNLNLKGVDSFVVYGRVVGNKQPEWQKSGTIKPSEQFGLGSPVIGKISSEDTEPDSSLNNAIEESAILVDDLEPLDLQDYSESDYPDYSEIESGGSGDGRPFLPPPLPPQGRAYQTIRSRQTNFWLPIAAIVGILAILGVGGWFFWNRSVQEQNLAEAKSIAAKTFNPEQLGKIEALRDSQRELQNAIAQLEAIPDFPGSFYPEAQAELAQVRPKFEAINKRLGSEELAAADLESAKSLAKQASQLVQKPSLKLEDYQSAQTKWQESVKLLEKIPKGSLAAKERDQKLTTYKANFAAITAQVQKQRQLSVLPAFWNRRIGAATKSELRQLKAAKVSKVQFIRTCSSRIRPSLNAAEIQKQGFRVAAFTANLCNYAWTAK